MTSHYLTPMRAFGEPADSATTTGVVVAVSRSRGHTFSKPNQPRITLVAGLGVEDDAHHGVTDGSVVRKSGVMSIVLTGGNVAPGDAIEVELPMPPHQRLGVV